MRVGSLFLLALPAFFAFIFVTAPESCVLAERDPDGGEDTASPPPSETDAANDSGTCTCCGKTILPISPDCSGHVALAVSAGDCPKDCKGSTAYLLCEGVCYSECACDLPRSFTLIDGGP